MQTPETRSTSRLAAWWTRRTLQRQLITLFVVLSLLPLAGSNLWGYLRSRHHLAAQAFLNLRNVAALEATQAGALIEERRAFLPTIAAGNEHLFAATRALAAKTGPERLVLARSSLVRMLQAKAAGGEAVEELVALSETGVPLGSSLGDVASADPASARACFERGRGETTVEATLRGPFGPSLLAAGPVTDGQGKLLGVLCARFRLDGIHRELVRGRDQRTAQAAIFLLSRTGAVLAGLDDRGDPSGTLVTALRSGRAGALPGPESWQERIDLPGGPTVIAAYAPVPAIKGGLLVAVPVTRALEALEDLKWQALEVGGVLVLAMVVAVLLTARALAHPLKLLSAAAKRTAAGALGESVAPGGSAEMVELGAVFNRMSASLKDSQDLLERRIEERTHELGRSREFTELLLNSLAQTVVVIDRSHSIVKANRAALAMYGSDLVGKPCLAVMPECAERRDNCPGCLTLADGRQHQEERPVRIGSRQEILSVQTFPVVSAGAEIEAVVRIGHLVTAEKRSQAQLMYQEKMAALGLLTAGIAHEIGNPLAAIESQLRLTQESPEPGRVEQTLGIVEREVRRIARLLRELVDFSRRRRDEVALLSVNQVIEDVSRLLGHDPRARNVDIRLRAGDGVPGVRAKEDHVVQVLLNLGLNALDAMKEGGLLVFETSLERGCVTVHVRDTGGGVSPDTRDHIFEPFFTTKEPGRGTGLGLFVSKGIVESLGGTIELESSGAAGTVFVVRIPVPGERRAEAA